MSRKNYTYFAEKKIKKLDGRVIDPDDHLFLFKLLWKCITEFQMFHCILTMHSRSIAGSFDVPKTTIVQDSVHCSADVSQSIPVRSDVATWRRAIAFGLCKLFSHQI